MRSSAEPVTGSSHADASTRSVATSMIFDAPPAAVWEQLLFYEQIEGRPPLHLRLLLPVPLGTEGEKSRVGDEARCLYQDGYLIKRVTGIEPRQRYSFSVVEQALTIGGGMRLSGGEYTLRAVDAGRAELTIATRYTSPKRPRWLWEPVERAVCHAFHRHLLRAMRRAVAASAGASGADA